MSPSPKPTRARRAATVPAVTDRGPRIPFVFDGSSGALDGATAAAFASAIDDAAFLDHLDPAGANARRAAADREAEAQRRAELRAVLLGLLDPKERRREISRLGVEARARQRAETRPAAPADQPPDAGALAARARLRSIRQQHPDLRHGDAIAVLVKHNGSKARALRRQLERAHIYAKDTAPRS